MYEEYMLIRLLCVHTPLNILTISLVFINTSPYLHTKLQYMREYNSNLKKYKLTDAKIAKYLGYASAKAFYNSSARERILCGLEYILQYVNDYNKGQI